MKITLREEDIENFTDCAKGASSFGITVYFEGRGSAAIFEFDVDVDLEGDNNANVIEGNQQVEAYNNAEANRGK